MPKETIRVSLKQIFEAEKTLRRILTTPVEAKVAYRMNKVADALLRKFREIEKQRIALVDIYGADDGKGGVNVPAEKIKEFTAAFEKVLEKEIDMEVQPIPFSCITKISLSGADLVYIQPFIDEPTDEDLK